ncbi:DUF6907 domain-containing protein [Actinocatenispora comari]|uniref:Uncharacterized protein n=1 Tax=Actinocatenispora comari TaxID=2807577 RepID=A0A8J4ENL3_9ACTN|nr:hypothetical protein [Actinocatenispora comari]GIL29948.1 hypothetical protein NUM_52020 [Actinocatenispora comari]
MTAPAHCPAWCRREHDTADDYAHVGFTVHMSESATVPLRSDEAQHEARVTTEQVEFPSGVRLPANVYVSADMGDAFDAASCRNLAAALLYAAEAADRTPCTPTEQCTACAGEGQCQTCGDAGVVLAVAVVA